MRGLYTVLFLIVSNIFMTFAWYGNLKLTEMKLIDNWPLILIVVCSWGVAFSSICLWFRLTGSVHQ